MARSGVLTDLRSLAGNTLVYGVGGLALRAISFLLLPLYTRYLTPADFGIVAAAGAVSFVLASVFPLGLHGAMARFYFQGESPEERAGSLGAIWLLMVVVTTLLAYAADRLGPGLAASIFREIPYDPYLRLAVWTAYFNVLAMGSQVILRMQERPGAYLLLSGGASVVSTALVLVLVVGRGGGAYGYLLGVLLGAALSVPPALYVALREVSLRGAQRAVAWQALAFGLPLVPHAVGGWALEFSDRVILERLVPIAQVGVYSLGYQLGSAITMLSTAFNSAWIPHLFGFLQRDEDGAAERVARLTTYFILGLVFVALGWALLLPDLLRFVVTPAFYPARRVATWVIGAGVLGGLYLVPVGLLYWSKATRWLPLATLAAGATNIGLNLVLVPRYGMIAAAVSTLVANAVLLAVVSLLARRIHPLPYEYRRVTLALTGALALFVLGSVLPLAPGPARMGVAALFWLAYPLLLAGLGFFTEGELAWATRYVRARSRTGRAGEP